MNCERGQVQSVLRACDILKSFRHESETLLLSDVMDRTGLCKTTAFRLLQTLVKAGLVEQVGKGSYRGRFQPMSSRPVRMGFASQTDSEFCRQVTESLKRAAAAHGVHLITVNNRYSAREALRNADLLIREQVELVLEFQTYERVAPIISSKFLEARIPVIAIEIPHPGATFFGANNYQAGIIGGRALGKWAKLNWEGRVEQVLLLELPIAGPLPALRITGLLDGLRAELPNITSIPATHLNGKGDFDQVMTVMRRFLRHNKMKRMVVGAVNDTCALAALRAIEEAGGNHVCAAVGQNATQDAREELRRAGTRLIGSVAYFPERYGDQLIPLALGLLQNQPTAPATFVKHQLITPKNVDLIYPLDPKAALAARA